MDLPSDCIDVVPVPDRREQQILLWTRGPARSTRSIDPLPTFLGRRSRLATVLSRPASATSE
jgi:hypothetical protein